MARVVLKNIIKRYGDVEAVCGIDLNIESKEFVVLVGPSGCGKSTTLRMIAGLEEITEGSLSIEEREVNDIAPKDRDVAMVFQNYALYPHLDIAKNIGFGLSIRGVPKPEITATVNEVAETLGLTELLKRKPAELSGGQRQRVAMGRAIVRHPKVFLFDEPLSNLDAKLRTQMRAEIKRLHRHLDVTSVYVTHDQVEAMTLADRIVVMSEGHIEQIGTPMELFMDPANLFVAGFIGSPPMNQLTAVLENNASGEPVAVLDNSSIKIRLPGNIDLAKLTNGNISVGIRAEDVLLEESPGCDAVSMQLDLVEPLGSEALLHTTVAQQPFIIRTPTYGDISHLNGLNQFFVNLERIKIFDRESGVALNSSAVVTPQT